ncbi:MAG: hypothetical protein LBT92_02575 [Rickettsiales bacterium]|jgi:hypothetical protein|nr:hypothetical protein [Rickettsiales bacterium]
MKKTLICAALVAAFAGRVSAMELIDSKCVRDMVLQKGCEPKPDNADYRKIRKDGGCEKVYNIAGAKFCGGGHCSSGGTVADAVAEAVQVCGYVKPDKK